jgi:hypothetical protein
MQFSMVDTNDSLEWGLLEMKLGSDVPNKIKRDLKGRLEATRYDGSKIQTITEGGENIYHYLHSPQGELVSSDSVIRGSGSPIVQNFDEIFIKAALVLFPAQ